LIELFSFDFDEEQKQLHGQTSMFDLVADPTEDNVHQQILSMFTVDLLQRQTKILLEGLLAVLIGFIVEMTGQRNEEIRGIIIHKLIGQIVNESFEKDQHRQTTLMFFVVVLEEKEVEVGLQLRFGVFVREQIDVK
jgi:hypothetical protein